MIDYGTVCLVKLLWGKWGKLRHLYIRHHSVKGNVVFFLTKIYISACCLIPGNNQNSCAHYSVENIACGLLAQLKLSHRTG